MARCCRYDYNGDGDCHIHRPTERNRERRNDEVYEPGWREGRWVKRQDTINAVDRIEDPCPNCGSKGTNRIWSCGSVERSGEFHQSQACRDGYRKHSLDCDGFKVYDMHGAVEPGYERYIGACDGSCWEEDHGTL